MSISDREIYHIASLAKLGLSPEQTAQFSRQLAQVLDYMQQLNQLDTSQVSPTYHAVEGQAGLREDKIKPGLDIDQALSNAPQRDERNFIVPKII
jgi:aspartyl-tRNA(Asn)/glutamyl-tRNA(Gln) amidotransferase subunit C